MISTCVHRQVHIVHKQVHMFIDKYYVHKQIYLFLNKLCSQTSVTFLNKYIYSQTSYVHEQVYIYIYTYVNNKLHSWTSMWYLVDWSTGFPITWVTSSSAGVGTIGRNALGWTRSSLNLSSSRKCSRGVWGQYGHFYCPFALLTIASWLKFFIKTTPLLEL